MICPLCKQGDVTSSTYHVARAELRVEHADGTRCEAAPVDESGRYQR